MARITNDRLNEVSELVEHALDGDFRAQGAIKREIQESRLSEVEESHSTSDFPAALRAVTNVAFLAQYQQIPSVYTQYTRQINVNNLRPQTFYSLFNDNSNMIDVNGGEITIKAAPGGLPRIPELTEYPTISFSASESSLGVRKFGARVNFSFEMLLNDEWNVLESLPTELAQLARNQEDIVATEVVASPTGPNPAFFNNTNRNIISTANGFTENNPVLDIDSLDAAISVIRTRTYNGNPVVVPSFTLMVPPALESVARRITGIQNLIVTDSNGEYNVVNPVAGVNVLVNPWLPIIDTSANVNKTWYLFPTGSAGIRPAFVFSKIRGRETPELRIASATGNYLGGGEVPGREGSFLNDDIEFRVRHYVGAAAIGYETTAVSNGTAA